MKLNKLLQRQLNKYLPESCKDNEELQAFIQAVHNSYESFERDLQLSERAFRITEEEYLNVNDQLKHELAVKNDSIQQLRSALVSLKGDQPMSEEVTSEVSDLANFLTEEINRRVETEKQLELQRAFYERILNQIPADIAIIDADHRYLFINPSAIKNEEIRKWIIGKTEIEYAEYRGRPVEYVAERMQRFNETIKGGVRREWEEVITRPDGEVEYHLRILHPIYKQDGSLDIMVVYGFNLTERKKIEEKVKQSEAKYKSIFNNSQALICTHDLEGKLIDVNPTAMSVFGYSKAELIGRNISLLLPHNKRAAFNNLYLSKILAEGRAEGIMTAYKKDHKLIHLLYQNYMVNEDGMQPYIIGFAQDITQRIQAEKGLRESEEKYRNIIANMNLGLVEVDRDEKVKFVNNSFSEMSGYPPEELIGENVGALLMRGVDNIQAQEIMERRSKGISDAYELRVVNKNGQRKWWLISGAPVINSEGEFKGSIGIHLDITPQKQLEAELRKAKAAAEQSSYAKEVFLANISHEIRTPMNAILGISRLLQKTHLDKQQKLFLDTISSASNNLLVIINDLLDLSKIESGKIILEHITFDLHQVVQNVAHILEYKASEKGIQLHIDWEPGIHRAVWGDPFRINQVLINLVGNAIKFTEKGTVHIICALEPVTEHDQQCVSFKIKDTGIGMNEEFKEHLFEKFTQEDESVTRRFGGTGLGMNITKQLVELMGGTIEVESAKGVGTTISFSLLFDYGTLDPVLAARNSTVDESALQGCRVLLVEDNEMNRLLAKTIMNQRGAVVEEAENGRIAVEMLQKDAAYDVILMDVQMPLMDGVQATRYIRHQLQLEIPIIALTASAYNSERSKCLEAGMNDYLAKPFDEEDLVKIIFAWVNHGERKNFVQKTSIEPEADALYDLGKLRDMADGDEVFLERMVNLFIKIVPESLVQLQEAYAQQNFTQLGAVAHKLKPSILNMGISTLRRDVLLLENRAETEMADAVVEEALQHITEVLTTVVEALKVTRQ
ncbi:PAS domain-containing hybrid sensor histidine kinase/response regulator [Edaphocola flava]|uniref:PAS domain-containing hybrid sensor histidine kinase/response regulator n=1 Tax=Edaphocola flava TaxID=2499629 RepID=UPI00100A2FD5|nr:PAS domain-containing hybrid sensor histidine kinase/response regulator [Edaphocola flava]